MPAVWLVAAQRRSVVLQLVTSVSDREKFVIDTNYYFLVTGNLEKAQRAYDLWAQIYPRDTLPPGNPGAIYVNLGQYDKALEKTREALNVDRGSAATYASLVGSFSLLNRLPVCLLSGRFAIRLHSQCSDLARTSFAQSKGKWDWYKTPRLAKFKSDEDPSLLRYY